MKSRFLLLFLMLRFVSQGQTDSTDIIVSKLMKDQGIAGLTLAVVKDGKTLVNKGYGYANLEFQAPVTSETVIRLGSVSKQFFTTAILKLQEDGKISIGDYVHKFFPDAPETWRMIQVKHLMSHTSGLKREGPAYDNNKIQPDSIIIKSAYPLPLDFKPGEKYQYSNIGYYMLAEIIARVSKLPWQVYITNEIFVPAGMNKSFMTDFHAIIPNRASGYMHNKNGVLINAETMYAVRPSGGFLSTSSDMIRWDNVLREKNIILKKESWELLWSPFVKTTDKAEDRSAYGFGWQIDYYKNRLMVAHGGANTGFRSYYVRFITDGLSIIIMTNTDEARPANVALALADYYFRK
jgi:D-alanyl-D-alanine carboxypeptidase